MLSVLQTIPDYRGKDGFCSKHIVSSFFVMTEIKSLKTWCFSKLNSLLRYRKNNLFNPFVNSYGGKVGFYSTNGLVLCTN